MRNNSKTTFLSFYVKLIYNAISENENRKKKSQQKQHVNKDRYLKSLLLLLLFILLKPNSYSNFFLFLSGLGCLYLFPIA